MSISRFRIIILPLIIVILSTLLAQLPMLQQLDQFIYDRFSRHSPVSSSAPADVVVVEASPGMYNPASWVDTLDALIEMDPTEVYILPPPFLRTDLSPITQSPQVHFALRNSRSGSWFSLNELFPGSEGMHRSLVWPGTEQTSSPPAAVFTHDFYSRYAPRMEINFFPASAALPHITFEDILKERIIGDVIKDRHVVAGPGKSLVTGTIYTPRAPDGAGMSTTSLVGYALQTQLHNNPILTPAWPAQLGILLFLGVIGIVIFQYFDFRLSVIATIAGMTGLLLGAWLLFSFSSCKIPVTAALILQLLLFTTIFVDRFLRAEHRARSVWLRLHLELERKMDVPRFTESDQHWQQLMNMLNQTLSTTRSLFFELSPRSKHLREIASYECSYEDIHEQRRDIERSPYKDALDNKAPIEVEGFLRPLEDERAAEEKQYLVPLQYGDIVYGFWTFGINPQLGFNLERIIGLTAEFADQISHLLHNRYLFQKEQAQNQSMWSRFLHLEAHTSSINQVQTSIEHFERRQHLLEQVMKQQRTATAAYDLFGQIIEINDSMEQILRLRGISPFSTTTTDLILSLTQMPMGRVQQKLRYVVINHETMNLTILPCEDDPRAYPLQIQALSVAEQKSTTDEVVPFNTYGVLLQIPESYTSEEEGDPANEAISEVKRIREGLSELKGPESQINALLSSLNHLKTLLLHNKSKDSGIRIARVIETIDAIIAKERTTLSKNDLHLRNRRRINAKQKLKPINDMERFLAALFRQTIADAYRGSDIKLTLQSSADGFIIGLRSRGYGLPQDELHELLHTPTIQRSPDWEAIYYLRIQLEKIGGDMRARSALSKGIAWRLFIPEQL
ncbi:MAG: hypothetical protein ACQEQK_04360 [Thermodesulfobacteriota bacterium]